MMVITWSDDYKIGVPMLDEDHQHLIETVNAFQAAAEAGQDCRALGRILDSIIDLFAAHCRREETLLDRQDYPGRFTHASNHQDMLARLALFAEPYRNGSLLHDQTLDKADFLSHLMLTHIAEDDPPFKDYLKTLV